MTPSVQRRGSFLRPWAFACIAWLGAFSAVAQPVDVDPPGRVARIGQVYGQAWVYSPDAGEWIDARRNQPMTGGDRVATDRGGRVELELGSTTLRVDSGSELEIERLDDAQVALRLHGGSLTARIRDARAVGEFELATTEGRFRVQASGRYRFDRLDRASDVTVSVGQALFEGPGNALTVSGGQRGEVWLEANGSAQYSITEPVRDAFAAWSDERDRSADRLAVTRYVSPEMTGAGDLDRYGRWEQSPDYGPIWFPREVASNWAPYSIGHWAWVRPWGWTWVDDAPWGFAPFHYGRWVYVRNNWCWAPGTYVARPVYAPALVAWVGGSRASVSVSIGGPPVGWFPLAPREAYVPGYRASPRYVREINVTHIRNGTASVDNPPRDYQNRKYPHAVTIVPASVLTNREPVGPSAARWRDTPSVRAMATQPTQAAASVVPPVASPPPGTRGLESRPFRAPEGRFGQGGEAGRGPQGRLARPPAEDAARVRPMEPVAPQTANRPAPPIAPVTPMAPPVAGARGAEPHVPPMAATRGAQQPVPPIGAVPPAGNVRGVEPAAGPAVGTRPGFDRREGGDRRGAGDRREAVEPGERGVPAMAPNVVPVPPVNAGAQRLPVPTLPAAENGPRFRGGVEERREGGRPRAVDPALPAAVAPARPAPPPAPAVTAAPRSEGVPNVVPPLPRVAVPPPPQVAPRPIRAEPVPPAAHPAEPPRAGPDMRIPEQRRPDAPPREERRDPSDRGPAR